VLELVPAESVEIKKTRRTAQQAPRDNKRLPDKYEHKNPFFIDAWHVRSQLVHLEARLADHLELGAALIGNLEPLDSVWRQAAAGVLPHKSNDLRECTLVEEKLLRELRPGSGDERCVVEVRSAAMVFFVT